MTVLVAYIKLNFGIMDGTIKRLQAVLKDRGETKNAFSIIVGINPSNFNRKMRGEIPFTEKDFTKINKSIGVSRSWLEYGDGDMYDRSIEQANEGAKTEKESELSVVPFYDVEFALGYDEMYNDTPNVPTKFISIPGYEKADFWCRASGDSMKPVISNGDIIALKEVMDWQSFLPMNEVYAIMTTNDLRTVKVVRKGSDEAHFTLHAYNEEFEDQEIPKSAITKVFKVLGSLKAI